MAQYFKIGCKAENLFPLWQSQAGRGRQKQELKRVFQYHKYWGRWHPHQIKLMLVSTRCPRLDFWQTVTQILRPGLSSVWRDDTQCKERWCSMWGEMTLYVRRDDTLCKERWYSILCVRRDDTLCKERWYSILYVRRDDTLCSMWGEMILYVRRDDTLCRERWYSQCGKYAKIVWSIYCGH